MTTMTAPIPERVALWTVANHDTYATLHRPDGSAAARFHVIAEAHAAACLLNSHRPNGQPPGDNRMNIDSLTIAQAREIASMFGQQSAAPDASHPFVGRYVILRCYSAGVHAGWLVSQSGDQAVLRDSRRLWSWAAKAGVALSGLSQHGLAKGKVDTLLPELALTGVIETIPCSDAARETINAA